MATTMRPGAFKKLSGRKFPRSARKGALRQRTIRNRGARDARRTGK